MASAFPNTSSSGKIPVAHYVAGMTESYPNTHRKRIIETSINNRITEDVLPINGSVSQILTDKYIEFRLKSTEGFFIDLASLCLEMDLTITKPNGEVLGDEAQDMCVLANGISNTLFKSVNVYFNDRLVESCPIYNYVSYVKMLKTLSPDKLSTLGICAGYVDEGDGGAEVTYTAPRVKLATVKGAQVCFPLLLDIATLDMYLLDKVDVRIRLEIANRDWYLGYVSNRTPQVQITKAILWVDKVIPQANAMLALNDSLKQQPIEYVFDKTLVKTYIMGATEGGIVMEQPFNNIIPEKLTMVILDNGNFNGALDRNPLAFKALDISEICITINGQTAYRQTHNMRGYYDNIKAIGLEHDHMITYKSFSKNRAVYTFNFNNEDMKGAVPVEMAGHLRISLTLSATQDRPHIIILMADSVGILNIDRDRHIHCDVRS